MIIVTIIFLKFAGNTGFIQAMLEKIRVNFEKLIAMYESEKAENESLRSALDACRAENEACRKQITGLEREIDRLRLTGVFTAPEDGAAAREKIDRMIKEIDKCISLLET